MPRSISGIHATACEQCDVPPGHLATTLRVFMAGSGTSNHRADVTTYCTFGYQAREDLVPFACQKRALSPRRLATPIDWLPLERFPREARLARQCKCRRRWLEALPRAENIGMELQRGGRSGDAAQYTKAGPSPYGLKPQESGETLLMDDSVQQSGHVWVRRRIGLSRHSADGIKPAEKGRTHQCSWMDWSWGGRVCGLWR